MKLIYLMALRPFFHSQARASAAPQTAAQSAYPLTAPRSIYHKPAVHDHHSPLAGWASPFFSLTLIMSCQQGIKRTRSGHLIPTDMISGESVILEHNNRSAVIISYLLQIEKNNRGGLLPLSNTSACAKPKQVRLAKPQLRLAEPPATAILCRTVALGCFRSL